MEYLLLIGGLILLILAGEALVRGAVGIALKYNVSTLVIGMTIVSFGTSAPELLVSLKAALAGHPEISIGNVIGSNIANIALVLGITTMILPIAVRRSTVALDWPIMMISTILFYLFTLNANIEWWEGAIFFIGLLVFNVYIFWKSKKTGNESTEFEDIDTDKFINIYKSIGFVIAGAIGLAVGANWLLEGAVVIARDVGMSEHVIGVTIIAFGTSVPELVTSVMAAFKNQTDISVGNLIGSNIFNLLGVLGITAVVREIPVTEQVLTNDIYWVLGISLLLFPLMIIGYKIDRLKGFILFLAYCVYIYFVVS